MRRGVLLLLAAAIAAVAVPHVFAIPAAQVAAANTEVAFTDRSGIPLGTILSTGARRTVVVPLERISPFFAQAMIAAEDRRFYSHAGVDWIAAARAFSQSLRCICNAGGASTITMQLARERFDLPSGARGKLLQLWYASRIEAGASKDQILSAFLNQVPMGGNLYGVESAARDYFGMPAHDLDLAQAALLAGVPNDPVRLSPRMHLRAARARQRQVLQRMAADGFITISQATTAARETIRIVPPHSNLLAAQQLLFRLAASGSQQGTMRTTIDLPLQRFVQAQAQDVVTALAGRNVTQAAAIVVDNRTGEVLAYAGSTDYLDDAYLGRNDGVMTLRQPGSTLKPFLYEFALERGAITPRTILADVPSSYAIPYGGLYSPEDYSTQFAGPVPVRIALANSLNVPAVRVLSRVGVDAFLERLRALGFDDLKRSADFYGLGLTLGAGEVRLWDLARAYVTLARAGSAIPLRTIVDEPRAASVQIGDPASWRTIAGILSDRYARARSFGIGSVIDMPFPAIVKTGTSSNYRDTWTAGGTPEYTVAVWVGNFSGEPMRRIAGVTGAGPLWNRIMLHLYENRDPPRFPVPKNDKIPSAAALAADARNSRPFDQWRAHQNDTIGPLRVLVPSEGDVYEDALAPNDTRRSQQQIEFRISRPRNARVTWLLNSSILTVGTGDSFFWPVRAGSYTLTVHSGSQTSQTHFRIIPRPPHHLRGFTIANTP